eukprot:TRINITY_DN13751_c0_g1_i1.p1 TRINITY_DN13751_c0_g1~~TRINITY_DN13751_c0_g1_i1.p1  ORF type:complete len:231 (+),score=60.82 TRINITY_DN13751_c0_g1_i1:69-761(+)
MAPEPGGSPKRSSSLGALCSGGAEALPSTAASTAESPLPKVPPYLSVHGLTRRRKLSASTGNLHAYMAEDYHQLNWPLPKMYGKEKYGYSLIDVEVKGRAASVDPRFVKEIGFMSKKLIRLNYDQQIVDNQWRITYKALLAAEHRRDTCGEKCAQKTKDMFKVEVANLKESLLTLQEQRDNYANEIKATIKKEAELDELREYMENSTRERMGTDSALWTKKFNIRSMHKK